MATFTRLCSYLLSHVGVCIRLEAFCSAAHLGLKFIVPLALKKQSHFSNQEKIV